MLSIDEINLLQAQNEGLKKQNKELQQENIRLKEEIKLYQNAHDTEQSRRRKFEKICNLVWEVYRKTDYITIALIVSTIIEILYDKENTVDTITRGKIIDKL